MSETNSAAAEREELQFETEVGALLDLVTHSLYSNAEIFMRELISNSSDAIERLRFAALGDKALTSGADFKIKVSFDKDKKIVTISDNGMGMTRQEVIEHLGTVAKSGTKEFIKKMTGDQAKDSKLIGQFGVGFYSAFVVADKVLVRSRRAGMQSDQGVAWESDGKGKFAVSNIVKQDAGTEITLVLKSEHEDFLNEHRLQTVIKKYSDYVVYPIEMLHKETITPDKDADDTQADAAGDKDVDKKTDAKAEPQVKHVWKQVNKGVPLWMESKADNTDEEYQQLYKHLSNDFENPLTWSHNRVEGKLEYISLLYIPKRAPFDLWQREKREGLKLYVRNVFIMDDAEHLMPNYLRFIKGVVDSSDLPLNVSREILQSNKILDKIRSGCVKRVLGMLESMAKDKDSSNYKDFWSEFGQVLKEGVVEDFANRDRIAKLLRFNSTHDARDLQAVDLDGYVERMQEGQDKIYYIVADSHAAASSSPLLEVFRKKNIEVLLLSDRVDEWLTSHLTEYAGKNLVSVAKGALDLGKLEDDKESEEALANQEKSFEDTLKALQEVLSGRVKEVRLTNRLTDSPSCVVHDENDMSSHMQRLMSAAGQTMPESKPILELNPEHAIVQRLKGQTDKQLLQQWGEILLSQSLLAEGDQLKDPSSFVKTLNSLLLKLPE